MYIIVIYFSVTIHMCDMILHVEELIQGTVAISFNFVIAYHEF